ncbi:hypothetical protein [Burkholderia metallica]|nr:hypothetical protein [Burkholderia metallica]
MIATLAARYATAHMNRVAAEADTVFVPVHRTTGLPACRARLTR